MGSKDSRLKTRIIFQNHIWWSIYLSHVQHIFILSSFYRCCNLNLFWLNFSRVGHNKERAAL